MKTADKKIFITGGLGFIGRALVHRLHTNNRIVIFDNLYRHADHASQDELLQQPNVIFVQGDVLDRDQLLEAMDGCTSIIHLASIAGVDTVLKNPVLTMEVSLLGTYNTLWAMRQHGHIEHFIDFSTSEVFGSYAYRVQEGDTTSLGPVGEARWTYAVSKLATEHLGYNFHRQYGTPFISIRPFNIYGPGQIGPGAIKKFVQQAICNEDIYIHNDGSQIRAWCYIDDIVDAVILCLETPMAAGQVFNIGNPRSAMTIFALAERIVSLAESQSVIRFVEWNFEDIELRVPNIDKAQKLIGFNPKVEIDEGLLRTIEWYRKEVEQGSPDD